MLGKYVLRAMDLLQAEMSTKKKEPSPFAPIEDAIEAFRDGRMMIVVDDEDRENEGDLTIAAEKVTPDVINFMAGKAAA